MHGTDGGGLENIAKGTVLTDLYTGKKTKGAKLERGD
jgi:hypothetical protein